MKSIRDVGTVTQTGTAQEESAPAYRTPVSSSAFARGGQTKTKGYAKGGVTRGDGICQKGHTKGKVM